jgi:hypothetical protein
MVKVMFLTLHQNIWLLEVIVTDILGSGQLSIIFSMLDPFRMGTTFDPVEELTDLELFQSYAPELISPNIPIHSCNEAHDLVTSVNFGIQAID